MARLMPNIPAVEPFIIDKSPTSNLDTSWKKWKEEFELFIAASGISDKKQALALLLHLGGPQLRDIYSTLKEDGDNFDLVKQKFTSYFQPRKNTTYERFKFKDSKQEKGESNTVYVTRLKTLAESCEFASQDDEIRDHFIYTCRSKTLKTKLLREEDLTLEKLIEIARNLELSQIQATEIEQKNEPTKEENVNRLSNKKYFGGRNQNRPNKQVTPFTPKNGNKKSKDCYRCGGIYSKDHKCPAMGRKCYNCGRENHLSKVCREKSTTKSTSKNRQKINKID